MYSSLATPARFAAHSDIWQAAYHDRAQRSPYHGCTDGSLEADAASWANMMCEEHIEATEQAA